MTKRINIKRELFLINMVLFVAFSFEFFIRNNNFLGTVLIFNGIINLLAFQQAPKKVASITILLNVFNALIGVVITYSYFTIGYIYLYTAWLIFSIFYVLSIMRQTINLISYNRSRKRQKKRMS